MGPKRSGAEWRANARQRKAAVVGGAIVLAGVVAFFIGAPADRAQPSGQRVSGSDSSSGSAMSTNAPATAHDADHGSDGPPPEQTIVFTGDEYSFAGPATVRAARTRVEFRNLGEELHEISFARLARGSEPPSTLAEMDRLWADAQFGGTDAPEIIGGSHEIGPGEITHVDLDLTPGLYLVSCPFPDPATSEYHFSKGMIRLLIVR